MEPKKLTDKFNRDDARRMRNKHWLFMERLRDEGGTWFCPWDKYRRHGNDGVCVDGLIGWGILDWVRTHRDWFKRGRWSDKKCAVRYRLTEAGLNALENWTQYDMEPVYGGLVEPGWQAIPTPLMRKAA
jgi:hypothetical protein